MRPWRGVARVWLCASAAASALLASLPALAAPDGRPSVEVVLADGLTDPLTPTPGDPARGRALVAQRHTSLCLLCHTAPIAEVREQGNLAGPLAGAGARWSAAQLRLRLVDARRLNPATTMPAFHRPVSAPEARVAAPWAGQPVLSAQQVEDIVAWLQTLKD